MALIRRCGTLLWIRTKLSKLTDEHATRIVDKTDLRNVGYVLQRRMQTQARSNARHEVDKCRDASDLRTKAYQIPVAASNPEETAGMCYSDVKALVDESGANPTAREQKSFALRLLKSCRDMLPDADLSRRQDLVRRAWKLVENLGETLTVEHYNVLLSAYANNSQYLDAEEFLNTMRVAPDQDTYRLLMEASAEVGDCGQVLKITRNIKDMGYSINEAMFNALILAHMVNGDLNGAQDVTNTMKAAMIEMSPATYCALSRGYAAQGDLTNLNRILKLGNLKTKQLLSVVKSLSNSENGKHISHVMKHLPSGVGVRTDDVVCAVVELTHLGRARDALEVINCLPNPQKKNDSSVNALDFFLYELVESETATEEILEICENLAASERHPLSLHKVAEAALRSKREETALAAFAAIENHGFEIRPHFYWPLLVDAASNKTESDVIRLIERMINDKVRLDYETLKNYAIPFLSATDPLIIVRKLQDCGVKISEILTPLLATLLMGGNLDRAASLSQKLTGKIDKPVVIESLLQGYVSSKNVDAAAELLKNIKSSDEENGNFLLDLLTNRRITVTGKELVLLISAFDRKNLRISKVSAEALEPGIKRINGPANLFRTFEKLIGSESPTQESAHPFIPHPRYMSAEQLESHFTDLSNSGGNTRGVLRRLVQTHCRENNLTKAVRFAEIFNEKGFDWTTGMLSGMFSVYVSYGKLEEAEKLYRELRTEHKGFKIDDHKIIDYATALVNGNELEKALKVLGEQENVRHGPATVRNCWRLLKAVAASGDTDNVKTTLDLLIDKGYSDINIHVLGPLIKSCLVNGDLNGAVTQFKRCAETYHKVPIQQELLRAIVVNCKDNPQAQEQLGQVLAAIQSVHGGVAANSQLFMALAATDRQQQLRALIKIPAVNQSMLILSAQRLTDEKDLAALRTILKACRGVKSLDTTIIYDSIVTLCSRFGDYKTALNVWEEMEAADVVPSTHFVEKLQNLLKAEKIPVPSELRLNRAKSKG